MNEQNFSKILNSCVREYEKYPTWEQLLQASSEEAAAWIQRDIQGSMSGLTQSSPLNLEQGFTKNLQPMLWLLEFGITQFSDGYIQSLAAENEHVEILWHSRSAAPSPSLVLQILFSNLVNTLLSIRLLTLTGFDGQALILLRWFVELADILVAIVADINIYKIYVSQANNSGNDYEVWRDQLAPGKIRSFLKKMHGKLGLSSDLVDFISRLRQGTYQKLSIYTHANWGGQVASSMPQNIENPNFVVPSLGGGHLSHQAKSALITALMFSWLTWLELEHLLVQRHSWHPDPTKSSFSMPEQRSFSMFFLRLKVFRSLTIEHYEEMQKTTTWEMS